jgi:HD-GYP domain-containing protein (c-di-GMP phosphodiesterase class II)
MRLSFQPLRSITFFLKWLLRSFRFPDSRRERRKSVDSALSPGHGFRLNGVAGRDFSKLTLEEIAAELRKAAHESRQVFVEVLRELASASDDIDPYTRGHSERVTRFSVEIAKIMELPEDEIERIRIGALIHDIGKITIDAELLNKPAVLTESEYEVMKTHIIRGYELLKDIPQLKDTTPGMRYHHEQLDGKGYPHGLKGEEIPMIARIIAVADCFDAMTTIRPYQAPLPIESVLAMIRSAAGVKYDETVVEALARGVRTGRIMPRSEDRGEGTQ